MNYQSREDPGYNWRLVGGKYLCERTWNTGRKRNYVASKVSDVAVGKTQERLGLYLLN